MNRTSTTISTVDPKKDSAFDEKAGELVNAVVSVDRRNTHIIESISSPTS